MIQAPHLIADVLAGKRRWTIVQGDCLDGMRRMEDGCVDSLVTDPPYGIDYKPDVGKPIANDKRPFIWWLHDGYRILKDGGGLVCFCRWDVQETFRMAIEAAGFRVRSQLVWDKVTHGGQGDCKSQFIPCHEVMWWAVKGRFSFPSGRPASIMAHRAPPASGRQHPTQKPIPLMRDLVRSITPPGGVVVDPCAGVGSTIEAAVEDGFRAIGFELDSEYCRIGRARVGAVLKPKAKLASPVHAFLARALCVTPSFNY